MLTAIVATGLQFWLERRPLANQPDVTDQGQIATGEPSPAATPNGRSEPLRRANALTYDQALEQYGDWRIQLNENCQARPARLTVKTGTTVMLDNRSGASQMVSADGRTYVIAPYSFRLLTTGGANLPHTVYLHCGQGRNVALITAQF